jgi:hypothetical protein
MSTPIDPKEPAVSKDELAKQAKSRARAHHIHEAEGAAGGAIAGAAMGAIAGPAGVAAGAVIGGVVGAVAAKINDEESERHSLRDGELDEAIGVMGGDLGAPNLEHPPAIRGTYSSASSGGGSGGGEPSASGPMSTPED